MKKTNSTVKPATKMRIVHSHRRDLPPTARTCLAFSSARSKSSQPVPILLGALFRPSSDIGYVHGYASFRSFLSLRCLPSS